MMSEYNTDVKILYDLRTHLLLVFVFNLISASKNYVTFAVDDTDIKCHILNWSSKISFKTISRRKSIVNARVNKKMKLNQVEKFDPTFLCVITFHQLIDKQTKKSTCNLI